MTPEQLKASILQYAMKGKVTEQLENDGDASDLLPHLHIDDKIIANEAPFDIPDNWLWIPIGNLGETIDTDSFADGPFGSNLKTIHYIKEPEVRIIQLSNIGEDGWRNQNVKYTSYKHLEEVIPRCEVHPGDFVIAKMMPAGRTIEVPELGTRITLGSDAMKFVPNEMLDKKYLLLAMHSNAFLAQVYAEAHGITRVRTTLKGIKTYVLPIPPLEEQHRIVAKIEELLPYVDRYAVAYEKIEKFNAKFPEDMKKSILQYAIQGKLVEQRPEEGTAEELYQQIQEEKQKLIKEGKIKKEKPLAEITEDEIPFDIPESWKWCRLSDIYWYIDAGKSPNCQKIAVKDEEWGVVTTTAIQTGYFDDKQNKILPSNFEINPSMQVHVGDILITRAGPMNRTGIACNVENIRYNLILSDKTLRINMTNNFMNKEYIVMILNSPQIRSLLIDRMSGMDKQQVNISQNKYKTVLLPIPPLAEQERIVAKVNELLPYCDQLIK